MKIAVPKEIMPDEKRVALVPSSMAEITQLGCTVAIQKNAGLAAHYLDKDYKNVEFYEDAQSVYQDADLILKVQPPLPEEIAYFKKNALLVSFLFPAINKESIQALSNQEITSFAMELIPRISRAQSMDALSSQATASGYKAVLIAAELSPRFFPMLTTAAGTIRPANVLVIGAGVAGLQAIATAKRLGAMVKAYDIRSATKEQVESLGAKMIHANVQADAKGGYARELTAEEKQQQQALLTEALAQADVVISTALLPGKPAPKIIQKEMLEKMMEGSLIVDIAAEAGGNCVLTEPGKKVNYQGVEIYGPLNLPSLLAKDASSMYARNIVNFIKLFIKEGHVQINWDDPILKESVVSEHSLI